MKVFVFLCVALSLLDRDDTNSLVKLSESKCIAGIILLHCPSFEGGDLDLLHKWRLETLWALVELPPSGSLLIFEKQNTWFINRSDVPRNHANFSVPLSEYMCFINLSFVPRKRSHTHLARFSVAQRLFCKKMDCFRTLPKLICSSSTVLFSHF